MQLSKHFDAMDSDIKEACVEFNTGFEGEVIGLEYVSAKNGCSLEITQDDMGGIVNPDLSDINIAIVGDEDSFDDKQELEELIERLGGNLVDEIDNAVDLVICNELNKNKKIMDTVDEFCIPLISEKGMLYRYGACDGVDDSESEDAYSDLFECTYEGGFYDMFYRYGIGAVVRRTADGLKEW